METRVTNLGDKIWLDSSGQVIHLSSYDGYTWSKFGRRMSKPRWFFHKIVVWFRKLRFVF